MLSNVILELQPVWITFNLKNSTYHPYQKENNQKKYINTEYNHPPSILKPVPISTESELLSLFSSEEIFKDFVTPYQDAKSGYKHKLTYHGNINKTNSNKREQKNKHHLVQYILK